MEFHTNIGQDVITNIYVNICVAALSGATYQRCCCFFVILVHSESTFSRGCMVEVKHVVFGGEGQNCYYIFVCLSKIVEWISASSLLNQLILITTHKQVNRTLSMIIFLVILLYFFLCYYIFAILFRYTQSEYKLVGGLIVCSQLELSWMNR